MRLFSCNGCAAKDAELARVEERAKNAEGVANQLLQEKNALLTKLLDYADLHMKSMRQWARDSAGVAVQMSAPPPPMPVPPPLDPVIDLFLDAKFVHGTTLWRQQRREAEKLIAEELDVDRVCDVLSRGQRIEF